MNWAFEALRGSKSMSLKTQDSRSNAPANRRGARSCAVAGTLVIASLVGLDTTAQCADCVFDPIAWCTSTAPPPGYSFCWTINETLCVFSGTCASSGGPGPETADTLRLTMWEVVDQRRRFPPFWVDDAESLDELRAKIARRLAVTDASVKLRASAFGLTFAGLSGSKAGSIQWSDGTGMILATSRAGADAIELKVCGFLDGELPTSRAQIHQLGARRVLIVPLSHSTHTTIAAIQFDRISTVRGDVDVRRHQEMFRRDVLMIREGTPWPAQFGTALADCD